MNVLLGSLKTRTKLGLAIMIYKDLIEKLGWQRE
jgi:hypothetical protein